MLFFAYIKEIIITIIGFFVLYLFNRNKTLKDEKTQLILKNNEKDTIINIQAKDIHATEEIKPTDNINDSIDRLSDKI